MSIAQCCTCMHERLQKGLSSKSRALPHRAWPSSQGCFNSPALALSIDYSVYFVGTSIALQRTPTRSRCAEPMQRLPGFDDIGRGVCGGHQRPWRTPEWHVGTDGIAAGRARAVKAHSCLLYTSPSPRDRQKSRMPSSA